MKKIKRFVLLIEHSSAHVRQIALNLAGTDGSVLIARNAGSAVEYAKQYRPTQAVIAQSSARLDSKFLPNLLKEFSPETEIVIVDDQTARTASQG